MANTKRAFNKGKTARKNGKGRDENPYPDPETESEKKKHLKWLEGWEIEDSKINFGMRKSKYD